MDTCTCTTKTDGLGPQTRRFSPRSIQAIPVPSAGRRSTGSWKRPVDEVTILPGVAGFISETSQTYLETRVEGRWSHLVLFPPLIRPSVGRWTAAVGCCTMSCSQASAQRSIHSLKNHGRADGIAPGLPSAIPGVGQAVGGEASSVFTAVGSIIPISWVKG